MLCDDDEFIFDDKIQVGNRKSCVGGWSVKVNMTYFQQSPRYCHSCGCCCCGCFGCLTCFGCCLSGCCSVCFGDCGFCRRYC